MAAETKRGCGYRKVGGVYLVGGSIGLPCGRLPYPLTSCPVCGEGIHFGRALTLINPLKLLGTHDNSRMPTELEAVIQAYPDLKQMVNNLWNQQPLKKICQDTFRPCFICDPNEDPAYIMFVGEKFYPTPADFMAEARELGISKRLPNDHLPKKLVLGKTIIYLAHKKACVIPDPAGDTMESTLEQPVLLKAGKLLYQMGIFSAFIPQKVEKIYWQSEVDQMPEEEKQALAKRGITPVGVPDGDQDHA